MREFNARVASGSGRPDLLTPKGAVLMIKPTVVGFEAKKAM